MPNNPYQFQSYQPRRQSLSGHSPKQPDHSWKAYRGIATGILAVIVAVISFSSHASQSTAKADEVAPSPTVSAKPEPSIAPAINTIISQAGDAQIGVAVENITTGKLQTAGQTVPFDAASTAKLIVALNYYHLVETGQASLSEMLGSYNAQFQIKQMINQSNNDAWHLLTDRIGLDELALYASANGIHYDVDRNALAPADMAMLLTKLYRGELLNQTNTQQLLKYMQHTNDEDLIPAVVPKGITVFHKYGLLNGELHDAAILKKGATVYALVIYTKNTDDSDDAVRAKLIHRITAAVTTAVFNE